LLDGVDAANQFLKSRRLQLFGKPMHPSDRKNGKDRGGNDQ